MGIEKKFIEDSITSHQVSTFLEHELDRAGFSKVDIQRTPMVTRIAVAVTNPGRVIGKKGATIRELTEKIQTRFGIDNPQISVVEVTDASLDPMLIAKRASKYIEMGKKPRAILHMLMRDIMRAGALGAEVIASGKIAPKGGRSKRLRVAAGFIPKAGEPTRQVWQAHYTAYPRSGAIGLYVRILPKTAKIPGRKELKPVALPKIISHAEDVAPPEPAFTGGAGAVTVAGDEAAMRAKREADEREKREYEAAEERKRQENRRFRRR